MTVTVLLPILLIGVLHWLMPSLVPRTLPFGVRVPADHADDPVVTAQRRRYRLGTAGVTVVAAAIAIPAARHAPAVPVAVGTQLTAGVALYLLARHRILRVKAAEDWFGGRRQVVVTDTSLRTRPEPYPWRWAVPPVLLLAATAVTGLIRYPGMPLRIPAHFGPSGVADRYVDKSVAAAFGPLLAQAALTALLLVLARAVVRSSPRLDAEDDHAAVKHRRFVAATARALLVLAACLNVTFLFASLTAWRLVGPSGPAMLALSGGPALVGTVVLVAVLVHTGQGGSRLRIADLGVTARRPGVVNRDDDGLYRWGLIYYNPDDPAVFVPKRFGIGWTVNMARPLAWLLLAATAVLIALGPLLGSLAR